MGTPQCGARTVPVRSRQARRGALEKSALFGPDNPLRTGTVRGPTQSGPRTVPVRSARADRGAPEKGDVFGPDSLLRTGTVRGPMQREVPTGLNRESSLQVHARPRKCPP